MRIKLKKINPVYCHIYSQNALFIYRLKPGFYQSLQHYRSKVKTEKALSISIIQAFNFVEKTESLVIYAFAKLKYFPAKSLASSD